MHLHRMFLIAGLALGAVAGQVAGQQAPSYGRDVKPFFARYCLECHNGPDADGGLSLETYKGLLTGGAHGPVLKPGQPDASALVRMVEGRAKRAMPPKKAKQPGPAERALLRAWVAAGAKEDAGGVRVAVPDIKPRAPLAAPVPTLAYHPGGGRGGATPPLLAAGDRREVLLLDPGSGDLVGRVPGQNDRVTALAFLRDGLRLA